MCGCRCVNITTFARNEVREDRSAYIEYIMLRSSKSSRGSETGKCLLYSFNHCRPNLYRGTRKLPSSSVPMVSRIRNTAEEDERIGKHTHSLCAQNPAGSNIIGFSVPAISAMFPYQMSPCNKHGVIFFSPHSSGLSSLGTTFSKKGESNSSNSSDLPCTACSCFMKSFRPRI